MSTVDVNLKNADHLRAALTSLARCGERARHRGDWGDGHWGAAVAAGCFFMEESVAELACSREVERQLAHFRARYADRFAPPFEQESSVPDVEGPLLVALDKNIDRLCWVGHNVIYAALSLKALRRLPDLAAAVPGIARLMSLFDRSIPGRSWIGWTVKQVMEAPIDEAALPLSTPAEVSRVVLEDLASFKTIFLAESHDNLIGHLLDFAQAVNLLHDLGYEDLYTRALSPLRRFMFVLRSTQDLVPGEPLVITSPVDKPPLVEAPALNADPLKADYWRRDFSRCGWDGGHTFKFLYAYYDHVRRAEPELARKSYPNFMKILGGSWGLRMVDIRKSHEGDFADILLLLSQLWPDRPLDSEALRRVFMSALASDTQEYLSACIGPRVIGLASLSTSNNLRAAGNLGHLDELVVDSGLRETGVGSVLLEAIEKAARVKGCLRLELNSGLQRQGSHRFYEKRGFERRAITFSGPPLR